MAESEITEQLECLTFEEISQRTEFEGGGDETDGASHDGPGFIYIIWEEGTTYFKCGRSNKPSKRLGDLQTGNPRRLTISPKPVTVMSSAENDLLKVMDKDFASGFGGGKEWFRGNKDKAQTIINEVAKKYAPKVDKKKAQKSTA